jgi:hypothetical protein
MSRLRGRGPRRRTSCLSCNLNHGQVRLVRARLMLPAIVRGADLVAGISARSERGNPPEHAYSYQSLGPRVAQTCRIHIRRLVHHAHHLHCKTQPVQPYARAEVVPLLAVWVRAITRLRTSNDDSYFATNVFTGSHSGSGRLNSSGKYSREPILSEMPHICLVKP